MKTIINSSVLAFAALAGISASQAQADTVWHFPYKGAPYATQSAPVRQAAPVRITRNASRSTFRLQAKLK